MTVWKHPVRNQNPVANKQIEMKYSHKVIIPGKIKETFIYTLFNTVCVKLYLHFV